MISTEAKKIKALLWLIAACRKYGTISAGDYYRYVEEELKMAHNTGLALLNRLLELGLIERETLKVIDCAKLWRYVEWLTERV